MKKRVMVGFLILVSAVVWTHNLYRIIFRIGREDTEADVVQEAWLDQRRHVLHFGMEGRFVYRSTYRDPFRHWLGSPSKDRVKPGKKTVTRKPEKTNPKPKIRFCGIMRDAAGVLAIIESSSGELHFTQENAIVDSVRIVKIGAASIVCEYENSRYALPLAR